ncbi:unnamed protein product [Cercospora beticola]|nr:unnamed protein product [Cercospora beticola]
MYVADKLLDTGRLLASLTILHISSRVRPLSSSVAISLSLSFDFGQDSVLHPHLAEILLVISVLLILTTYTDGLASDCTDQSTTFGSWLGELAKNGFREEILKSSVRNFSV